MFSLSRFAHDVVRSVGYAGIATILGAEVQDLANKLLHDVVRVVLLLLTHHGALSAQVMSGKQVQGPAGYLKRLFSGCLIYHFYLSVT